ncbi:hypothetical protein FC26_GL001003 [Paucilactobacillus vaccinostercus DSM 20634]|jgi:prephenate dehydratase|uniref:Prephenate dehydratase n=1 Tax=Paucilactobacillus vaccinostercus DSM 20634 TaxID=1423813 RepID=A0A0R2AGH4_9LACO|nr:hypothetical protein [Paucilactobacillus vaccinostercus]KRM61932.1 hypothetical protein FC26_GL001003 [Paucilactobacillus vaccinostercus DSM 20634]
MRKIHTLGPKATDSYEASQHIPGTEENEIVLHDSFDDIIEDLAQYAGDYLLLPAAYQSKQSDFGWRELSYEYWDRLKLETVYHHPLKTLCLIANFDFQQNKAVIHPATTNLLNAYLKKQQLSLSIHYAGSKAKAYDKFVAGGYRFTIVSEDSLEPGHPYQMIQKYHPDMVWCLYHIIK